VPLFLKCFLLLACAAGLAGPALAQSTPLPPITVRPSGIEDEGAASRERQERLMRRMQADEYRFRHICTHCLGGVAAGGAPFHPLQALGGGKGRAD
jgi:hypothetical protein